MKKIKALKPTIKGAIAPTIMATLIFFLTYFLFGAQNTMIGPFATLSFLRFRTMRNHYECMIKNFAIYAIMAVLAFFAVWNLPLCILINALALFWIADILIDEYNPNNYFPAGMALIFFQIAPAADFHALIVRLEALIATFLLIFLFVFVLSEMKKKENILAEAVTEGFENCEQQFEVYRQYMEEEGASIPHEKMQPLHQALHEINLRCTGEIYAYNRASLLPKGKTNWYCQFVLLFQIINYLTMDFHNSENLATARTLYVLFRRDYEHTQPTWDYHRLNFRLKKPDLRSFRLRFALRQVITLTPCLVFAYLSDLPNAYWLVISVFFMMIPYTDHTLTRIRQRVLGTVAGILICLFLFSLFNGFYARVIIMTIANFLIYGSSGYGPTVAYITCSALAIQTLDATITLVLFHRLLYTLAGAAIALLANRFVFPIRVRRQIEYLVEMIRSVRATLVALDPTVSAKDGRRKWEVDQKIIKTYLLTRRLEILCQTLPEKEKGFILPGEDKPFDYHTFERRHMSILSAFLTRHFT